MSAIRKEDSRMKSINAKTLCALTAAVMLCGCSDSVSSSKTAADIISAAEVENDVTEDAYACFPDGVSTESEYATELLPDSAGVLDSKKYGVRLQLPSQYRAYDFDSTMGAKGTKNCSCKQALFITSAYFPDVREYIRISFDGLFGVEVKTYESMKQRYPTLTLTEYTDYVKSDLQYYSEVFMNKEYDDTYDYIGIKRQDEGDHYEEEKIKDNMNYYGTIQVVGGICARKKNENYEIIDIKSEPVEFDNGCFGLRIDYTLRKKDVKINREVYWLYKNGNRMMHRVEINKDTNADASLDTKALLESIDLYTPEYVEFIAAMSDFDEELEEEMKDRQE